LRILAAREPGLVTAVRTEEVSPRQGTVVVEVAACGVCGSDLPVFRGEQHADTVGYFGHEFSGVVSAVGEGVEDLGVGDRVASGLLRTCGRCPRCLSGHPNYCVALKDVLSPGGFAERTLVRHGPAYSFLVPVPDGVPPEHAALHEPTSCAVRIVEQGPLRPGDRLAVIGLGPMGLLAALIARSWGAGAVVGLDVADPRLAIAESLGIVPVDRRDEDWRGLTERALGIAGADLVLETSGKPSAFADALALAVLGGRVVVGSAYHERADLDLEPIMRKELSVTGAKGPFPRRVASGGSLAMELIASGGLPIDNLVCTYPVEEAQRAFLDAASGTVLKPMVRFPVAEW
jgi:L-iditol 2-dehydrogenase